MAMSDVKRHGQAGTASTARQGIFDRIRGFPRASGGGATAIVAVAVVVVTIGATTVIVDHNWLVDQRDVLKSATDAAAIATTVELERSRGRTLSQEDLAALLSEIARTYAMLNLQYLSGDRLARAEQTLEVKATPHMGENKVDMSISADLGGTLLARHLPLTGYYGGPEVIATLAGAELLLPPVEVVLAIDASSSMLSGLDGLPPARGAPSRIEIVRAAAKELVAILEPSAVNRVAVALLPWQAAVRLPEMSRIPWETRTWAQFPTSRHYPAVYECQPLGSCTFTSQDQTMPASEPEEWRGCLDETRVSMAGYASYADESEWFETPSELPFAKATFPGLMGASYDCWRGGSPSDFVRQGCYSAPRAAFRLTPQPSCSAYTPRILPLSTDRVEIDAAIDALVPIGTSTYSTLGILWGQRLLSHDWISVWGDPVHPVDPALAANRGVRKAIVLLTDGQDNRCGGADPYCEVNSSMAVSRSDACDAVKEQGTEIFVIAAIDGTATGLALSLLNCSSQADRPGGTYAFLDHSDEEGLVETFTQIADQLRVVRRTY